MRWLKVTQHCPSFKASRPHLKLIGPKTLANRIAMAPTGTSTSPAIRPTSLKIQALTVRTQPSQNTAPSSSPAPPVPVNPPSSSASSPTTPTPLASPFPVRQLPHSPLPPLALHSPPRSQTRLARHAPVSKMAESTTSRRRTTSSSS